MTSWRASFLWDELPVVTLEYGSRLVCVGFWLLHVVKAFASRHLLVHDEDWHFLQIWNAGFLRDASFGIGLPISLPGCCKFGMQAFCALRLLGIGYCPVSFAPGLILGFTLLAW